MRTRHLRSHRGTQGAARHRTAGLAGLTAIGLSLALALPGSAQAATTAASDLAAPESRSHAVFEFDLFRSFSNCLAEAAHRDSMYPGIDPSEVNSCLGL